MVSAVSAAGQINKPYYVKSSPENVCDVYLPVDIDNQTSSIACLVDNSHLVKNNQTGSYEFQSVQTLSQSLWPISVSTKFSTELALGKGTAFLVSDKLMLTAAHCLLDSDRKIVDVTSVSAVFDYRMQTTNPITSISETSVCKIVQIRALKFEPNGEDWALVELEKAPGGRKPLRIDFTKFIDYPIPIYTLGHPFGLPMKYAEGSVTIPARNLGTFDAKISCFPGNSGSPVFSKTTNKVIGILVRGTNSVVPPDLTKGIPKQIHVATQEEINRFGYEKCQRTTLLTKHIASQIDHNDGYYKNEAEKTYFLGRYYSAESTRNYSLAAKYFHLTTELDPTHTQALCDLGWFYQNHPVDGNYDLNNRQAYALYKQALAITPHCMHHSKAFYFVGYCHQHGVGVELDLMKAVDCYKQALKLDPNHFDALELLAICYFKGDEAENFKEAFKIFKKLGDLGHKRSLYYLGECYYWGKGVPKDIEQALRWSQKASDSGFVMTSVWVSGEKNKESLRYICDKITSLFSF